MSAIASQAATLDRARAIGAGRAGRAWEFLELMPTLIEANAQDNEVRFLGASIATGLGLGTLARELIDQLAPAARSHPGVAALTARVHSLPDDRWPIETRAALARANLRAIEASGCGSGDWASADVEKWQAGLGGVTLFRARDGNVVARTGSGWVMRDEAGLGKLASERIELDARPMLPIAMFARGGAHLLARELEKSTPDPTGPRRLIVLMARDGDELVDAVSLIDLAPLLAHARIVAFAGEGACERLGAWLSERREYLQPRELLCGAPGGDEGFIARARGVLALEHGAQVSAMDQCRARINERYAHRDAAWWRARYEQARTQGPPLRVLVTTTRFSTFIQHSSRDLCAAIESAGMRSHLIIEPDEASQRCALNVAKAIDEFEPDVCVLINYPRTQLGDMVPASVPFVTWVQDAMPHLFKGGPRAGAMDWLMGHLYPELVRVWQTPRERLMPAPVLVSTRKFHDGEVESTLAQRVKCDVAYVSHHSATPKQLAQELASKLEQAHPGAGAMAHAALAELEKIIVPGMGRQMFGQLDQLALELTRGRHSGDHASAAAQARAGIVLPIAERVLRHQMLGWVSEACRSRGWRLKVFGRGWETHPTLSEYACGALAHDEELRAVYRCARVNLQAGFGWVHQRLMECALSGGCTLTRIKSDDVWLLDWWAQHDVAATCKPEVERFNGLDGTWNTLRLADHWQLMMCKAARDRVGIDAEYAGKGLGIICDAHLRDPWGENFGQAMPMSAAWLMGDPASSGFWDRESFERNAGELIENDARRASLSAWQARCTRENYTLESLARRLPGWIERGLGAASSPGL